MKKTRRPASGRDVSRPYVSKTDRATRPDLAHGETCDSCARCLTVDRTDARKPLVRCSHRGAPHGLLRGARCWR